MHLEKQSEAITAVFSAKEPISSLLVPWTQEALKNHRRRNDYELVSNGRCWRDERGCCCSGRFIRIAFLYEKKNKERRWRFYLQLKKTALRFIGATNPLGHLRSNLEVISLFPAPLLSAEVRMLSVWNSIRTVGLSVAENETIFCTLTQLRRVEWGLTGNSDIFYLPSVSSVKVGHSLTTQV